LRKRKYLPILLIAMIWAAWAWAVEAASNITPVPEAARNEASIPHQGVLAPVSIDYPRTGSVFPPEFPPPLFMWRDADPDADSWQIDITFDGDEDTDPLRIVSRGERLEIGPIDQRCVGPTNEPPRLTPRQAAARTWRPERALWETIKKNSVARDAALTITGLREGRPVSRGRITFRTAREPVGAPIFYRDVPLMPSELKKGVIKPLDTNLLPLVAWRLRDVSEPRSRLLMEGIHTCANCHSFSRDGKTMGLDLDGPDNDKGLYAIVPVSSHTSIRDDDVISWKKFRGQMEKNKRIGFMSQISPDGRYVITATEVQYYVSNFKDYRFLQVFYPTRGILAWYDRRDGRIHALPGADDPRYVHANAVWSPDGRYLVFARARAMAPYPESGKPAKYPNDPDEPQIQYDLYRIPFNQGQGGRAEPILGASRNGMSNSFPKISPDGRWIVFVQCRNGQLMRPDGRLYIVPAEGGEAKLMNCNTPLMNSWHSFSPNGRWMVFSSKSWSPYTRMFLTYIDGEGNDSPAILIENATASNRAVNIPEFVNVPPGGFLTLDAPAAEFYRFYNLAYEMTKKGRVEEAMKLWNLALGMQPDDAKVHNNIGGLLLRQGRLDEAAWHFERAIADDPELSSAHDNLGLVDLHRGNLDSAINHFQKALQIKADSIETLVNLGGAYLMKGDYGEALAQLREAHRLEPERIPILGNMAWILATCPDSRLRDGQQAVRLAEQAVELSGGKDLVILDTLGASYAEAGQFEKAIEATSRAVRLAQLRNDQEAFARLNARIDLYRSHRPFREQR